MPWVTEDMFKKIQERREFKSINTSEGKAMYKKLNNELRRETKQKKIGGK